MFKKNLHFVGIDNCENFVKICHKKNLSVINANMTKIPLQNNSADAIICIAVLHHLASEKSRIDALLEMKRLIKKNGKILLSVWSINQPRKTRRSFNSFGNNIVLWNNNQGKIFERYYYIFKLEEIKQLFIHPYLPTDKLTLLQSAIIFGTNDKLQKNNVNTTLALIIITLMDYFY